MTTHQMPALTLRALWLEMISTGLFEVSASERFVAQMIDQIERRP